MVTIVKDANGNDETYFRSFEWLQITFIALMNGWRFSGKESTVFDEEKSKQFCAALESGLSGIESDLLPAPIPKESYCPRLYLENATKINQLQLIDEFLDFCEGQPFRINFEN